MGDLQLRISNYVRRGISKQQMCKLLDISYIQLMDYLEQFNLIKEQEKEEILVNKIKELLKIKTIDQIAIELGVNYQYLKNKIHFISQNTIKEDIMNKVRWTKEEEDLLVKLRSEGKSYEEISKKIGKNITACSKKWSKMNIKSTPTTVKIENATSTPKSKFKAVYTKEDDEQIISLRAKGVSYKDIAKQLGRNSGDVIYARHYVLNGNKSPKITSKDISETIPEIQQLPFEKTVKSYNFHIPNTTFTENEKLQKGVDEVKVDQIRTYQSLDNNMEMIREILSSNRRAIILL